MAGVAVLYTQPKCAECNAMRRALRSKGIEFEEINATKDPDAMAFVTHELGHEFLPVVWFDRQLHWSGFRPEMLEQV